MKLKRKLYTRGEKQAFLELYKATRGFKKLPKGSSPRDVLRFNKLATDIKRLSMGDIKGFDRENAKKLLESANLPLSAKEVDHVIDKYTNKRALVRLTKQKNIKGNKIDYDSILPQYNKSTKLMNKGANIRESSNFDFDIEHGLRKPNTSVIKKLTKYAKERDIDVVRKSKDPYFSSNCDSYVETMPDMSKSIIGSGGKKYIGKITLNTGALEEDLAHEIGHIRTNKSKLGRRMKAVRGKQPQLLNRDTRGKTFLDDKNLALQQVSDELINVANENSATAYGNALLKKVGDLKKRKTLDYATSGYMGTALNHSGHDYRKSLKWM